MVLDIHFLWLLAYLILALHKKSLPSIGLRYFPFQIKHKSNWNTIKKKPMLLLLPAWWQCFLWLRAEEDTHCKRTGHLKRHGAFNFTLSLDFYWLCGEPSLPWFLTNSLFSQLAFSRKCYLWLISINARFSLEWWLSIIWAHKFGGSL